MTKFGYTSLIKVRSIYRKYKTKSIYSFLFNIALKWYFSVQIGVKGCVNFFFENMNGLIYQLFVIRMPIPAADSLARRCEKYCMLQISSYVWQTIVCILPNLTGWGFEVQLNRAYCLSCAL